MSTPLNKVQQARSLAHGLALTTSKEPLPTSSTPTAGEYCLLMSTGGTQTWQPCSYTDITAVRGAICYTEGMVYNIDIK